VVAVKFQAQFMPSSPHANLQPSTGENTGWSKIPQVVMAVSFQAIFMPSGATRKPESSEQGSEQRVQ
jgi:hypothetical protein